MISVLRKGKTLLITSLLATLTIALISILTPGILVNAPNGETKLVVLPVTNTFYTNETLPGSKFNVTATVVNVTDLQNWQIKLTWNSSLLNFSSIRLPSDHVFSEIDPPRSMITPPYIAEPGSVTWGCTYINVPYWTFNGTGTLCQIELEILAPPNPPPVTCNLTFTDLRVDTFLLDSRMFDIDFVTEDGIFTYIDTLSVSISPPGTTLINVGENVTFTASATGGVEPYTYKWYLNDVVVPEAENYTTWTFQFNASGIYKIKAGVTDALGYNASATAFVQTRSLSVTLSPVSAIVDAGDSITFTAVVSGGKSPYRYQWYLRYPNNTEIEITEALNHTAWTIIFNEQGTNRVKVRVTDSELTVREATSTITVLPTPTAWVKVIPQTATFYTNMTIIGDKIVFNVTVQDVEELENWQIKLTWDPILLNFSDIWIPDDHVFAGAVAEGKTLVQAPITVEPGSVTWGCTYINSVPYWTFNGTGTLCQVELEIIRQPDLPESSCAVSLANKYSDTFILKRLGGDIPFYVDNSTYTYMLVQYVTHAIVIDDTTYTVTTYSNTSILANSAITSTAERSIQVNAYGAPGTGAYVNITLPKALIHDSWNVTLNGIYVVSNGAFTPPTSITEDITNTYVYLEFTFESAKTIWVQGSWIVPEQAQILLITLMIASLIAVVLTKTSVKKKW